MPIRNPGRMAWEITREVGASVLTYQLFPLAVLGNSVPALPVFWNRSSLERRPILFVHGVFHNKSAFVWLKQRLAQRGWAHFREMDLRTTLTPLPQLAEQIRKEVEAIREEYQTEQVDIVAHSMGGIIARYYIQKLKGDGIIKNLITLGTPHQGTLWSHYSVLGPIRELRPGSKTLEQLNALPCPRITRAVSVAGSLDLLMRPRNCTHWAGARNIELQGVGHAGLLFSRRVFQIITSHCSE